MKNQSPAIIPNVRLMTMVEWSIRSRYPLLLTSWSEVIKVANPPNANKQTQTGSKKLILKFNPIFEQIQVYLVKIRTSQFDAKRLTHEHQVHSKKRQVSRWQLGKSQSWTLRSKAKCNIFVWWPIGLDLHFLMFFGCSPFSKEADSQFYLQAF